VPKKIKLYFSLSVNFGVTPQVILIQDTAWVWEKVSCFEELLDNWNAKSSGLQTSDDLDLKGFGFSHCFTEKFSSKIALHYMVFASGYTLIAHW